MTAADRDYSETLFLPKTDFPMRCRSPPAGEWSPEDILKRWETLGLYCAACAPDRQGPAEIELSCMTAPALCENGKHQHRGTRLNIDPQGRGDRAPSR